MWVHMMSAISYNVGDMRGRSLSGFSGSLNLCDRVQVRHDTPKMICDFMETIPLCRMSPRQDLPMSNRTFLLAQDRKLYVNHLPSGGATNITVTLAAAPYKVTWVSAHDPVRDQRPDKVTADYRTLTTPDKGRLGGFLARKEVTKAACFIAPVRPVSFRPAPNLQDM